MTIAEELSLSDVCGIPGYTSENRIRMKLVNIFIAAIEQCFTFTLCISCAKYSHNLFAR